MSTTGDGKSNAANEGERLNIEAYKALAGLYGQSDGEERLAELLRSEVAIDPIVREALAQALSPNGERYSGVRLRLANLGAGDFVGKMRTRRKKLGIGQQALQLIAAGNTRADAESLVAEGQNLSPEYVKKAVDYARKFAAYENEQAESDTDSLQTRIARQVLFHISAVEKADPTEYTARWYAFLNALNRKRETE